ncbi:YraN family protein [Fulvivirga sp. M361]|uniref:YraN family protein n=1 Tax=Fulvivirga sp. M361 TaxID=2594266 RepID=UPI00117B73AD|nr:YraN family protein [Fulvivirga sp. M361]TRX58685.1 YraN family protein [Fulvivirga sp. M361]
MLKQTSDKNETGRYGEQLAAKHLEASNYKIVQRNWRYKRSEIDIIAKKDDLLVFVEVKTKHSVAFGNPEDAVDEKKASNVMKGAEQFVFETDWHQDIRFDIIAVQLTRSGHKLFHLEDAFY